MAKLPFLLFRSLRLSHNSSICLCIEKCVRQSDFTLKDGVFNNNTASSDGGAILSTGGTFNLTDADFVQNRATAGLGGAFPSNYWCYNHSS